jgi:hypothetical protein
MGSFCTARVGVVEDCGTFWNVGGSGVRGVGAQRGQVDVGRTAVTDMARPPFFLRADVGDGDAAAPLRASAILTGDGGGGKGNIWNLLGFIVVTVEG